MTDLGCDCPLCGGPQTFDAWVGLAVCASPGVAVLALLVLVVWNGAA